MIIDSSAVISLPSDGEFKVKKKEDLEEIKPVEESGNSSDPDLNIEKDKINEKNLGSQRFPTGEIYNNNGELDRADASAGNNDMDAQSIDIII